MTTVQQVFDTAIHMMDEQNESSGATNTSDTQEYKVRTISILNAILPALYPYSDTKAVPETGRPICPVLKIENYQKPDFTQTVPVDDTLALGVLPYALAAHLCATEDTEKSNWFLNLYDRAYADLRSKIPAEFERIHLPYGMF